MKKVVLFIFLLLSLTTKCQTYTFTTLANYRVLYGDLSYDNFYLYNNKDNDFYLAFRTINNEKEAILRDEKNNVMHIFAVKENENKVVSKFDYKHSVKKYYDFSDCSFDYEETNYQDSLIKVNLIVFRTKKKKKIRFTTELIGEKSNYNHFLFFRKMHLHGYENAKNLLFKDDIIVTNYGNDEFAITLNELKEINITITIDKIVFN